MVSNTTEISIIQIIINSGVTIAAVSVAIYLMKKWMNTREATEEAIKEDAKETARNLADRHDKACDEIKQRIGDNRNFYERTYSDLKNTYETVYLDLKRDIGSVFEQQRIANGRTGKLERDLAVLRQSHEDRTGKTERVTDKC